MARCQQMWQSLAESLDGAETLPADIKKDAGNAYSKPLSSIYCYVLKVIELPPIKNKLKCEQHQGFQPLNHSTRRLRRKVNYHLQK